MTWLAKPAEPCSATLCRGRVKQFHRFKQRRKFLEVRILAAERDQLGHRVRKHRLPLLVAGHHVHCSPVAATLGAAPLRAWWAAEGGIALRATAVGAAFAAAVSLGEFGATAFLVRLETPTAPVQIVRLLGRPGEANIGVATALAVMLLVLTVIIVSVAERIRPRRSGGW